MGGGVGEERVWRESRGLKEERQEFSTEVVEGPRREPSVGILSGGERALDQRASSGEKRG